MHNSLILPGACTPPAAIRWLTLAIAIASPAARADPPMYTAEFITPGLNAVNAAAMNEAGDVVGTGTTASGGWVSLGGAPAVLLPLPAGAAFCFANDINDAGVIVGAAGAAYPGYGIATVWFPDGGGGYTIQQFGMLPGDIYSEATAVNNLGDIVGYSRDGMFRHPVLFTAPGGLQNLTSFGVFDPVDINDQRVLIDHSFTCKRLDLDTMIVEDLGVPAAPPNYAASRGEAINELGQVAGSARLAISTSCDHVAARYTNEVGWEVFSGCGPSNSAWDINDLGDVVMRLNLAPYVRFEGLGTFLIEDLIIADVGHWSVINGYGVTINNARRMAVPATNNATSQSGIILLTPLSVAGDINGDGGVDAADLIVFVDVLLGIDTDPNHAARADLNQDGAPDGRDVGPFVAILIG